MQSGLKKQKANFRWLFAVCFMKKWGNLEAESADIKIQITTARIEA
jgi:hypothetical protein